MIRLRCRDVNAVLLLMLVLAAGESPEFCQLRTYDGGHQSTAEGSSVHWRQREMETVEMKAKEEVVEHEDVAQNELAQKEVTEMIQRHVDQKVLEHKKITLVEVPNEVEEGEHEEEGEEGEGEEEAEEEGKQVPPGQTPWFQFNYRSKGKRPSVLLLLV
jgi:hypothetical protein